MKMKYSGYHVQPARAQHKANTYINRPRCTIFGRPAQQSFTALFVWEKLLGPLEFKRFIEVGTGWGNMSVFFMLHCVQKGANFITCERVKKRTSNSSPLKKLLAFNDSCVVGNVYGPAIAQFVLEQIAAPGRTVLFLDGGDKPHEFRLFVPALKPGDYVAIHDWGRAVKEEWVWGTIDQYGLEAIMPEENRNFNTLTAMWQRNGVRGEEVVEDDGEEEGPVRVRGTRARAEEGEQTG